MKEKLPSFRKFNTVHEKEVSIREEAKRSKKIASLYEEKINSQRKLEELEKQYIETEKENKSERERLKKEIVEQSRQLKEKISAFNRSLGEQEIIDLEI